MKMLAFTDTEMTKAQLIDRLEAHAAADEIAKGFYWEDGRGCAVGCSIHGDDHSDYERMFGVPVMLARLEDRIFEGLPLAQAKEWPLRFTRAIPEGADLSLVGWQFLHWLIASTLEQHGTPAVREACAPAVALLAGKAAGREVSAGAAYAAAGAAYAAADAAYAAADAADAADAAVYAAYAAGAAYSADAADAAVYAARAARGAAYAAYERMAAKLIELIEAAPVVECAARRQRPQARGGN